MTRHPISIVQSNIFYNDKDLEENWISTRVDIDSWMMLEASTQGHWNREAKNLGGDRFRVFFKAQVKGLYFT